MPQVKDLWYSFYENYRSVEIMGETEKNKYQLFLKNIMGWKFWFRNLPALPTLLCRPCVAISFSCGTSGYAKARKGG
jgi:hypothetical protein